MNGTKSTTASWRRVNRAALPHLPNMIDEPMCSDALHCLDDVLLSGSDDEYYDDSGARRRRIEEHAQMFLDGRRPFLLSASLRGPFGQESGWENPWRGKGTTMAKAAVAAERSEPAEVPVQADTLQTDTSDSTPPTSPVLPALPAMHRDLGSISGITALGETTGQPRKRSASTDWLRRKNLKRMRPFPDSDSASSPTAARTIRPVVVAKAFKTPALARSFSAPVEPRFEGVAAAEAAGELEESVPVDESVVAVSHISDSERCMSVPSDMLWTSHSEMHQSTSCVEIDETIMLDLSSSIDASATKDAEATVMEDTVMKEDINAVEEEDDGADLASQQIATEEAQFESQRSSSPAPAPLPNDATGIIVVRPSEEMHFDTSERASTPRPLKDHNTMEAQEEASKQTEDERLATQFQSPWSKPPALIMDDDMTECGAKQEDEVTNGGPDETEDETTSTINADAETETKDDTITQLPLPVASTTTQSPFSRESQWQLPAPSSPPALSATPTRDLSISQNPWMEESAPANLPTSPCSPGQDVSLPQFSRERHQQQEPFLPSLPIPIPTGHSSGTAPSTPDTKQSSLPTPDMTMSIKSFRRFRSPTPTPPPRRKSNKKGGPRSILKQTRRKLASASSAPSSGRRVQFSLPGDNDDNHDVHTETESGAEGGVSSTEGVEAEEEDFIEAGLSGTSRGRKFTCDLQAKSSKTHVRTSHRAASPPPQDKALMESLPSEVDKFQGHFASVVGRANGTALVRIKEAEAGAPGALDANTSHPAMDAKTLKLQQTAQQSLPAAQRRRESSVPETTDTGSKLFGTSTTSAFGKDKENAWAAGNDRAGDDEAESVVDDVQEVMDNLDDFLGMWDMDAELTQVRSSRV